MRRLLVTVVARPVGTLLVLLAVVGLGGLSLARLPLAAMPALERATVRVQGEVPGASMERLEAGLVRELEARLLVLTGADSVVTWSRDGELAAQVAFRWGVDPERARLAVVEAVDGLRASSVPVAWDVVVTPPGQGPALVLVVEGEQPLTARTAAAEDLLLPELAAIPGVARVDVLGGVRRRTVIRPDPVRLAAAGVAPGVLRTVLARSVRHRRVGEAVVDGDQVEVVAAGVGHAPDAVAGLAVPLPGGATIRLADLAAVAVEPWPDHGQLRIGGEPAVGLAVHLAADANALLVGRRLEDILDDLEGRWSTGLEVERAVDGLAELPAAVVALFLAAAVGALAAGLVLALLARRLGSLVVLLLVIPLSVCAALPAFEVLGLGLNLVSLVGMALAAGMLVDAAVVVLDACMAQRGSGPERAVAGTATVARAVVASAVTTAVVFVPALYLRHLAAALFRQLAVALMVTLLASLLFALLAVPVAAARLVPGARRGEGALARRYRRGLTRLSASPWWAPAAVCAGLILCAVTALGLPQQLLPAEATSAVELRFLLPPLPPGTESALPVARVTGSMRRNGERDLVGWGFEPTSGPPLAAGFWRLPSARDSVEVEALRHALQGGVPGLVVHAAGPAGGVLEAVPLRRLAVEVSGRDRAAVEAAAERVAVVFRDAGIVVLDDVPPPWTTVEARPTELGAGLGEALDAAVAAALPAYQPPRLGELRLDESAIAVADVEGLPVVVGQSQPRPLGALVRPVAVRRPAVLVRHGGRPAVRLVVGEATAEVAQVEQALERARQGLSGCVDVAASGGVLDWREARRELAVAAGLGLVLVVLVLAAVYESLRVPVVVLTVLPFAALGGLVAQRAAGGGLDLGAGLGLVLLAGLAVNNGVLLLDRLGSCAGGPALWARRAAGRLRPVLVTTATTLVTLAPVAFAGGAGASLRATLARTVFAGLLVSTPAALFILPPLARLVLNAGTPSHRDD